jgi:cytochrome c peroxidase
MSLRDFALSATLLLACGDDATALPDAGGSDSGQPLSDSGTDAGSAPDAETRPLFDVICRDQLGLSEVECSTVAAWRLPDTLVPARGNRYGDDDDAARLGHRIFFDEDFANVEGVSCASCHDPDLAFQDGLAVSEVIPGSPVTRNSPSLYNVGWNGGFFFWDGRADSLWSQPLFAFENEIEMDTTRLEIAHRVYDVYRTEYEAIFGAMPDLSDLARFPATGKPGDASFDDMPVADRTEINRVAANVGKALEAYMRKLATGPSDLDRFIDGDFDAMSADARTGLVRFVQSNCGNCHPGGQLTDNAYWQVSTPTDDRGRAAGLATLLASPFNSRGEFFDDDAGPALEIPAAGAMDERAFRTPTMRNVMLTAPYRHDGSRDLETLLRADPVFEEGDEVVIPAFFEALTGDSPPAEWTTRPL